MSQWQDADHRYLGAALAEVRARLLNAGGGEAVHAPNGGLHGESAVVDGADLSELAANMDPGPSLERLCDVLGLSSVERDVLLLCAGVELDPAMADVCAAAHGDSGRGHVTFALALRVLGRQLWTALAPALPLRYWRLVEIGPGTVLTQSPLRIDERVLHFLTGVNRLDERLRAHVEPVRPPAALPASHVKVVEAAVAAWMRSRGEAELPILRWNGSDPVAQRTLAAATCEAVGLNLHALSIDAIPTGLDELATLHRLWEREAILGQSALLIEGDGAEAPSPALAHSLKWLIERLRCVVLLSGAERWPMTQRALLTFETTKPTADEQRALWMAHLGPIAQQLNGQLERVVTQFDLDAQTIRSASLEVMARWSDLDPDTPRAAVGDQDGPATELWSQCRSQARPRLDALAQRIESAASWEDLVIPAPQRSTLRDIAVHVRQQRTVYETWGFARKGTRGLGISALFTGASGTGKTMAAEALAHELGLDLYRIDLSAVVSKYIGETEKNLRRIFDAAEGSGVILLFDEADALFGKRSEVKDSHDRHANIEVSYLLQRMEAYRGLAILTTNMKEALDQAFLRRIRFVVTFPFPDVEQRADIWRRVFPDATPVGNLDITKLAQLNLAGGNIRNVALHGAFAAAEEGAPVGMGHLLRAARTEYAKLERPLTENETRGWLT